MYVVYLQPVVINSGLRSTEEERNPSSPPQHRGNTLHGKIWAYFLEVSSSFPLTMHLSITAGRAPGAL